jgi:hypothetical protein
MRKITAANVDGESLRSPSSSLPTTDVSNDRASMALEKWDGPVNELLPLFQTMAGAADTDAAAAARISTDFIMVYALDRYRVVSPLWTTEKASEKRDGHRPSKNAGVNVNPSSTTTTDYFFCGSVLTLFLASRTSPCWPRQPVDG